MSGAARLDAHDWWKMIEIKAHITGSLWKVLVVENQAVEERDTLAIMESMKMEIPVESPVSGVVKRIVASEGSPVKEGSVIMILEAKP